MQHSEMRETRTSVTTIPGLRCATSGLLPGGSPASEIGLTADSFQALDSGVRRNDDVHSEERQRQSNPPWGRDTLIAKVKRIATAAKNVASQ